MNLLLSIIKSIFYFTIFALYKNLFNHHLIIQVGQDHDDLDLLLRHHLPHAGDGGVQRVLGQDESLPVVET